MTTTILNYRLHPWLLAELAAFAMVFVSPTYAQGTAKIDHPTTESTRLKLNKHVHLNVANTPISDVMAALSDQTGVTIKAADYLCERRVTLHIDNLSASGVLDALNELNDWIWYPTLPGQVLVTRRRLHLDVSPAAIPRMMQASIPKDIRTFASITTPTEDISHYVNIFDNSLYDTMHGAQDRLSRTVATDQSELLKSLAPGILSGDPVSYKNLTAHQRAQLLIALVFPLLRRTDYQLLHGDLLPHVADVNNAVLKLSGNTTLLIGSRFSDGKMDTEIGFGAPIK